MGTQSQRRMRVTHFLFAGVVLAQQYDYSEYNYYGDEPTTTEQVATTEQATTARPMVGEAEYEEEPMSTTEAPQTTEPVTEAEMAMDAVVVQEEPEEPEEVIAFDPRTTNFLQGKMQSHMFPISTELTLS